MVRTRCENGDCLDLLPEIPTGSIDMILADPPYGTTQCSWDSVIQLDRLWPELKRVIKPRGAVVLCCAQPFTSRLIMSNMEVFKYCWAYVKPIATGFLNVKRQPLRNVEDIAVFCSGQTHYVPQMREGFSAYTKHSPMNFKRDNGGTSHNYGKERTYTTESNGDRYPVQTIEFKQSSAKPHPTQKPVKLMEYLINTYTNPGEVVLDFCMGSGTTGVAAVGTGREFVGMELDTTYYYVAKGRIRECK